MRSSDQHALPRTRKMLPVAHRHWMFGSGHVVFEKIFLNPDPRKNHNQIPRQYLETQLWGRRFNSSSSDGSSIKPTLIKVKLNFIGCAGMHLGMPISNPCLKHTLLTLADMSMLLLAPYSYPALFAVWKGALTLGQATFAFCSRAKAWDPLSSVLNIEAFFIRNALIVFQWD